MPPLVSVLQGLPLLSSLPQVTVAHLAQFALERVYAKREIVLQKGGAPTHLCFLLEGRLQGVDFTMEKLSAVTGRPFPDTYACITAGDFILWRPVSSEEARQGCES